MFRPSAFFGVAVSGGHFPSRTFRACGSRLSSFAGFPSFQHSAAPAWVGFCTRTPPPLLVDKGSIVIPLTSGPTLFRLKGKSTLKEFFTAVRGEDEHVRILELKTPAGYRVAQGTLLDDLAAHSELHLTVDGTVYAVNPSAAVASPTSFEGLPEESSALQQAREEELLQELSGEFEQLQKLKSELDARAHAHGRRMMTLGFVATFAVYCGLARLTWWDLNWDIMEPVTFFITSGTGLCGFLYYLLTRREMTYYDMHEGFQSKKLPIVYQKANFNAQRFEELTHQITLLQERVHRSRLLGKLRD